MDRPAQGTPGIYLVCCTQVLLQDIATKQAKQKDVATTYAMAMRSHHAGEDEVDWATVNQAIIARWGHERPAAREKAGARSSDWKGAAMSAPRERAPCEHKSFKVDAKIGRLSRDEGGPVTGYVADITVNCAECGLPFRFVGLRAGNHHSQPRVSVDGTELRAPIEPATHEKFATGPISYTPAPRARQ